MKTKLTFGYGTQNLFRAIAVITALAFAALSMTGCEQPTDVSGGGDAVISIAAIAGVTAPAQGASPVTAVTANGQYDGTVTWNGAPATFAYTTVYTATITLTAKSGYTLQGVPAGFFTVEGATSVSNAANSGVVTAVFPQTTDDPSLLTLTGTITISPNTGVTAGTELTATYSGSETVSFQWKKDGGNVGTASTTNPNTYTPAEAGSYTVTVSAAGYNPKTSAAVTVGGPTGDPDDCECNGAAEDCECAAEGADCECETCEPATDPECECNGAAEDCECEDCECETCEPAGDPDECECNGAAEDCECAAEGADCECETCEPATDPECECNGVAEDCECENCECEMCEPATDPDDCECNGVAEDCECGADCDCEMCEPATDPDDCECNGVAEDCECDDCDCETCEGDGDPQGLVFEAIGSPATAYSVSDGTAASGAVVIPATYKGLPVTGIGGGAFQSCTGLTSITIPNSVTYIGNLAFMSCSGLTSVTFAAGIQLTVINESMFRYCRNLASITIPNSVTSIGANAFQDCAGLTSVTIGTGVTSIGQSAFSSCSSLASITIPANVTSIGGAAFAECTGLASVTILGSVTTIGVGAFLNCTGLTSVILSAGVTTIDQMAFAQCTSLASVEFKGTIASGSFSSASPFPGDLRSKFYATDSANGTPGTYTRSGSSPNYVWTKQQ